MHGVKRTHQEIEQLLQCSWGQSRVVLARRNKLKLLCECMLCRGPNVYSSTGLQVTCMAEWAHAKLASYPGSKYEANANMPAYNQR